jgi:5-methylcytosine-specific restriction endonuclease McrA
LKGGIAFDTKHVCISSDAPQAVEQQSYPAVSSRVLVLNQSYEPISVCSAKKALLLMFLAKADLIEQRPLASVRSVRQHYPFPSVIRLCAYLRIPYKKIELSRKNIFRRDGHRCQYCGTTSPPLTIDHVIPRSRGGGDHWENLVCACVHCNNKKGSRTPEEANMRLANVPRRPHHVQFLKHYVGKVEDTWRPYLFMD